MKRGGHFRAGGFTLIEVMLAMVILGGVIAAIFSTWTGIVKASKVGQDAAAAAHRERMAMRVVEEALTGAQLYVANPMYYSFEVDQGGKVALSFVSSLPKAFPRSGKFGDALMRRVMFSVEAGAGYQKRLVLRQNPILMEMDEDERLHPVVLADSVKTFVVEVWDPVASEWADTWLLTNQLPKMVRVSLQLNYAANRGQITSPLLTTVVGLPTAGVQPAWQTPTVGADPGGGAGRGPGPGVVPPQGGIVPPQGGGSRGGVNIPPQGGGGRTGGGSRGGSGGGRIR